MADLEKTVKIIFEGEDKALTKSVASVAGQFDDIGNYASKIAEPLARAADGVLKMDAALAALAIGGMALAIKTSAEFNQGFALISTSVDATGEDLKKYRDNILSYAGSSVKSITDINAALYTAAQAGISWSNSLEFMNRVEQLAVANNANLNTTVDLLTGTMNAYGYKVEDVGRLNDIFFTSTLIGKQTIDSLGQSMGQVVGIAANFGVSFEALSAAISTLTAKGMETSEAITAVKGVITTIVAPSKEAADAASALGLNFSASALKATGFEGMLSKIMSATGGSADQMAKLFNEVRALNGVMQLTGDGMKFFNGALEQINTSAGAGEIAYQKMVNTFSNQSQKLINNAQALLIDVGSKLEPTAAGIAGSFSSLVSGIKIGVDAGAFDPLFKALDDAGKELSTWLSGVAKALPEALKGLDFSKLIDSLKGLGAAFGECFGNLDLTNVEDLHDFIQKIIDGIAGLIRVTEGMVDGFRPFFVAIKDFLISVANSDVEAQKMVGTVLALAKAVETFGLGLVVGVKAMEEYGASVSGVFNIIAGGAQVLFNGLQLIANAVQGLFVIVEGVIIDLLDSLTFGAFKDKFNDMRATVEENGKKISAALMQNGEDAGRGLDRFIDGLSKLDGQAKNTNTTIDATGQALANIPERKTTTWTFEGAEAIRAAIIDIGKEVVKTTEAVDKAADVEKFVSIGYVEDENGRRDILRRINELPDKKNIDVTLNKDKLLSDAGAVKTAIEWTARLNIAEVEAGVQKTKTMFDSVNIGIKSTGDLLGTLFGQLNNASRWNESTIKEGIEKEQGMRQEEFNLQKKLVEQQIALNQLKITRLSSGEFTLKVEAAGLQPHLENILWEILQKIQIRATEQSAEFLLGLGVGS